MASYGVLKVLDNGHGAAYPRGPGSQSRIHRACRELSLLTDRPLVPVPAEMEYV